MLRLVLGISGTGKSSLLMERIRQRAEKGKQSILLVPEQFTSSTESAIYQVLGDRLSGYVSSYSFTSLAEKLLRLYGGAAVRTLTDAGRVVLVRRALEELGDAVRHYRRHRRSAAFCQLCAQTIDELKSAGLTGGQLADLSVGAGTGREKLAELAAIFTAYETLLAGTGMDPGDRIAAAAERLSPDFFADRAVFVDEFDTFNASKKKLLAAMLTAAPDLTVALCCDGMQDYDEGLGLFSGAKAVAAGLDRLARENGVGVAAPVLLREDQRHTPELIRLNRLLSGPPDAADKGTVPLSQTKEPSPCLAVTLLQADNRTGEVKAAAAGILKLARQGVPFGSMAVICRDSTPYLPLVRYEFGLCGIPLFCDEATTPEHAAPAQSVLAALGLLRRGLSTEPLLGLVKSGLCELPGGEEGACALENYAYTWRLSSADWREPFTRSPGGYDSKLGEDEAAAQLALAEGARAFLVEAAERFIEDARGKNAREVSRQIYFLLDRLGAGEALSRMAEALRDAPAGIPAGIPANGEAVRDADAGEAVREWDVVMEQLDQMAQLVGGERLTPAEYEELFTLLLRSTDLGHIPKNIDAVIFTTAGRMRLAGPEYCFVLGLAEGEFPAVPGESGLLTYADRQALIRQGIEMPDCFENRAIREQVCFYKALTAPARGLWLSWPGGPSGLPVSSALAPVIEAFAPQSPSLTLADCAVTPAAALDLLGMRWRPDSPESAALWRALEEQPRTAAQLNAVGAAARGVPFAVRDTAALTGLLGSSMRLSPSRIERYYTCPFSYFMEYVLRLRPRRPAELAPNISGSLVHWVLENALLRTGIGFSALPEEELLTLAAALVDEYVAAALPGGGARFEYRISRLKKSVGSLLLFLQKEQQQSEFAPAALELEIGHGPGSVPPHPLLTPDGRKVEVVGKIDRVDLFEKDGVSYLRVLDYKTGSKKFKLEDVWCGLNCQMLFYLFTLAREGRPRFADPAAAGVLYLMADPASKLTTRQKAAEEKVYELDGILLDDPALLKAMDRDGKGMFLPFKNKKGAESKLASAAKLGRIQKRIDDLAAEMASALWAGKVEAAPLCPEKNKDKKPCKWCDWKSVCGHEDGKNEKLPKLPDHPFEEDEPGAEEEGTDS